MTTDPSPVCILAMASGKLRGDLEAELTIDGYEVRCAESIAEVEARLTPGVADVMVVGSLDEAAAPCALLRGLRDGRLAEGRVGLNLPAVAIVPDATFLALEDESDAILAEHFNVPLAAIGQKRLDVTATGCSQLGGP